MSRLVKSFLYGMATGISVPVAIMFNSYLSDGSEVPVVFNTPDWYIYVHLFLFFPVVGMINMNTSLPLAANDLMTICVAIIFNGFLYAIAFYFIKKISLLFR